VYFVTLGFQHANAHAPHCHMWHARLYNIFSTLSHKRHDCREKKVTEHKTYGRFAAQILPETFLILRRNERDMIKVYSDLHVNYPSFLTSV